jgi:arginyl-tRNA synthetase
MIYNKLKEGLKQAFRDIYNAEINEKQIQVQKTRKEFDGDLTIVIFPFLRLTKSSPEDSGNTLGDWFVKNIDDVTSFNVIKGFLNLEISSSYWLSVLNNALNDDHYGTSAHSDETIMVEYSSPNTNKPLHLGHIRNNLLGYAISEIHKATGKNVIKTNIVNDRGIHICKSMLAWKKWGNGETPKSAGMKGDHLVGKYYVIFDQEYKKQIEELTEKGLKQEEAKQQAPLMLEAQEMLLNWEKGDAEINQLWKTMNDWVYNGFDKTYKRLGVDFDKIYYESETYKVGKDTVLEGIEKGLFYRRDDNSVWADLQKDGLDEKLLLRSDGTSVYMTQDIGTAQLRQNDYNFSQCVYVVGNEQDYHFKVLAILLEKLGFPWAKDLYHLSYGMVELPEGKMKSREGTVVDADDLMDEMTLTAKNMADELGKLDGYSEQEKRDIYRIIGLGALKYFILKVDPKKNMTFNPHDSIDFNGNTGPFIQYTYARIRSVLRKAGELGIEIPEKVDVALSPSQKELELIKLINDFQAVVQESGNAMNPAIIANYTYELVKEYNQFYHDHTILKEKDVRIRDFRIALSLMISRVILKGMGLLGIEMPERM